MHFLIHEHKKSTVFVWNAECMNFYKLHLKDIWNELIYINPSTNKRGMYLETPCTLTVNVTLDFNEIMK